MIQALNDLRDSQQATSDETLERLISEFSESISGAAGDEMKAFATTIESMNKTLSDQVISLSEGQQAMQDTSKKAVEEMMTAMADGSSKMKEEVNIAVTDLIAGVEKSVDLVTDKLLSAAEQSATQMEKATANFDSALEKLSVAVNEIGDIEIATKNLLDGLNQALSGTSVAIESVSRIGDHLSATSTKMESTADKILQSTDKVLDASDQVALVVDNLKSMNSDIKTLWESYHDRFDGVDKSVATLFEKLQEGLANYAQSTNDYVLGLDRHAAKVVQELASATKELTDTVETIGDSMGEQRALLARKVIMQDKVNEALA
jgi:methyl-accepting chemotaxis protein